jgi:hypothetical protein
VDDVFENSIDDEKPGKAGLPPSRVCSTDSTNAY